ncbi:MAG: hypothetical protein QW291_09310 [Thermofilaceae archaeon]
MPLILRFLIIILFGFLISLLNYYCYDSDFNLYGTILLFCLVSCYVYYYYPYYIGNDTFRDLSFVFNILKTGYYQGSVNYPINILFYFYSIIIQFLGIQNMIVALLLIEIVYIVSFIIILRCFQKIIHIGHSLIPMIILSQPQFVFFYASGFINQSLAILYAIYLFYLAFINNGGRFISKRHIIPIILFSLLLPLTHGFVALYMIGLFSLTLLYSWKNRLVNINVLFIKRIILIMFSTLVLYSTYTSIVYLVPGMSLTFFSFLENVIYSILKKDNLDIKFITSRTSGINLLWMYIPFANLLALVIAEYLYRSKDELEHSFFFDLVFFTYPAAWVAIGIITTVDPTRSLLRHLSVPATVFLSMYPRKVVSEGNTISKTIVLLIITASVTSLFTSGSIISTLDYLGSGRGYIIFPPNTIETEFLSRFLSKTIQQPISIVTDVNLGKGISIAAVVHKIELQSIRGHYNRHYFSVNDNERIIEIEFKLLGSYDFILDNKSLNSIKLNKQLLLLRPMALEYMNLYRLNISYDDLLSQSKIIILCTYDTYLVLLMS